MPAISSNRIAHPPVRGSMSTVSEALRQLEQLQDDLEAEVCGALLEDDVARAERLVRTQARVRKLARIVGGLSDQDG